MLKKTETEKQYAFLSYFVIDDILIGGEAGTLAPLGPGYVYEALYHMINLALVIALRS